MFKDIAFEYFDAELYVIPLNGKIPLVKNWSMFSTQKPSELLVDSWVNKYPKANVGLLTGKQTGVIAIDIDKDSALNIVPPSPVIKKGKKGETRFFKYNGEANFKRHDLGIELLSTGNQTVLPPSIHPETKEPYKWVTPDTLLEFDIEDLPTLNEADPKFLAKVGELEIIKGDTLGRHNTLIEICGAMVGRGEDPTSVIEELINYDNQNHKIPYFTDKSEPHGGGGYSVALKMYSSVVDTAKRKKEFVEPKKVEIVFSEEEIQKKIDDSKNIRDIQFPKPTGMLKDIRDLILARSHKPRPKFALAGALSLIGTVLSNKIRYGDATPNLYQLIIAESGEGKDAPLKAGKNLLIETGLIHLIGMESYRGDKSIIKKFDSQVERMDIIDEISKLFKTIKSNNAFSSNIAEVLTEIWNSSNALFTGFTTSESTTGICFNPCLNLISATTPNSFSETFSNSMLMQGFGGRFLYVFDDSRVKLVDPDDVKCPDHIDHFITYWGNMQIEREEIDISKTGTVKFDLTKKNPKAEMAQTLYRPEVTNLPIEDEAKKRLSEIMYYFDELSQSSSEVIAPIIHRAYQQTKKIMLISAACNSPIGNPAPLISINDVEFAFKYVEACLKNTDLFFKDNLIQSKFHRDSQIVVRLLRRFPLGLSKTQLTKKLVRHFKSSELYDKRNGIITNLVAAEKIIVMKTEKDGRNSMMFYLNDSN